MVSDQGDAGRSGSDAAEAPRTHHYVGKDIDAQKTLDDARKRLEKDGEESIVHYHAWGDGCDLDIPRQRHDFVVPQEKETQ